MDPENEDKTQEEESIQAHPAFSELREKYEWDDTAKAFPPTLKSGKPNPLFGINGVLVKLPR